MESLARHGGVHFRSLSVWETLIAAGEGKGVCAGLGLIVVGLKYVHCYRRCLLASDTTMYVMSLSLSEFFFPKK